MTPDAKRAARTAVDAAFDALDGNYIEAARKLVNGALDLVPGTVVQQVITDEQARRQNAIAEQLEADTFAGEGLDEQ